MESILYCPISSGYEAGVWVIQQVTLCLRKLISLFPAGVICKQLLAQGSGLLSPTSPFQCWNQRTILGVDTFCMVYIRTRCAYQASEPTRFCGLSCLCLTFHLTSAGAQTYTVAYMCRLYVALTWLLRIQAQLFKLARQLFDLLTYLLSLKRNFSKQTLQTCIFEIDGSFLINADLHL